MGGDGDDLGLHDVLYFGLVGGQQQGLHRDHAQQHPVLGDIAGVHRLLVQTDLSDAGEGLLYGGVGVEVDKLRGHDRAGGVLRVFQQLVDLAAGGRVGVAQDTGDHVGGHVLDDVHGIVQVELVQNFPQLLVAQGVDDLLLILAVLQIGEHVGGHVLGQQPKDHHLLVGLQLVQKFGDVHLVHLVQVGAQGAELLAFYQLQQQRLVIIFVHGVFLLPLNKKGSRAQKYRGTISF